MARVKVLRVTRHEADQGQLAALEAAAAKVLGLDPEDIVLEIVQHRQTVSGAEEVRRLVVEHGAQLLEAVLPITILAEVVGPRSAGVPVIRAVMNREVLPDGSARFTFSHYEKVVRVEVVAKRL